VNKLRPFKAQGMPWHGLATDGVLPTTVGNKTVAYDATGFVGPCKAVRHPQAPGVSRNTAQVARDTAQGHTWRDYALLTGPQHNVNGGPALGADSWLYCDAGGATWVMRLEAIDNGATMTFKLWLDALFGRSGRDRSFTPQVLATLSSWAPEIPSWYGGSYTAADVIDELIVATAETIAPSPDGASVFVNIRCTDQAICAAVYPETAEIYSRTDFWPVNDSTVAVLEIAISGLGDIDDDGNGITATLTEDMAYETGTTPLVTNRQKWTSAAWGTPYSWDLSETAQPTAPTGGACPADETLEYTFTASFTNQQGDNPYATSRTGIEYDAVLYKTPDGTIERSVIEHNDSGYTTVTLEGAYSATFDLNNCLTDGPSFSYDGGPTGWYYTSCTQGAATLGTRTRTSTRKYWSLSISVFGEVYSVETLSDNWTEDHDLIQTFGGGTGFQYPNCGSLPSADTPTSGQEAEVDGQAVTGFPDMTVYHEMRLLASNLAYVLLDYPQLAGVNRDMHENVVGVNEAGTASELLDQTTAHAPLGTARKVPDLRKLVWSWQPVSEESSSADVTLFVSYSGDRYQYI